MTLPDFLYMLEWFVLIWAIGIIFLPITLRIFGSFFDKGYIYSKILGIIIVSYCIFAFGVFHILPFTSMGAYTLLALLVAANGLVFMKDKDTDIALIKKAWIFFIIEDLLFFCGLWFWSFVRAHQPNINGLEKFMDFGFVNSILRSAYFPPKDMWLPPFPINYYYFGHMVTACLTRLSGIPSVITFNLMLATLFAFCFVASGSLGANLLYFLPVFHHIKSFSKRMYLRIALGGFLIAYLVTCAGNIHMLYGFFKPYVNEQPVPLWQLQFQPQLFPNNYWYPNATRFIYHTIHEFPIYSFVVSDLHGHVLDIPFVLLVLSVFFSMLISWHTQKPQKQHRKSVMSFADTILAFSTRQKWYICLGIGFLSAVLYMTNAWDGLIYLMFAVLLVLYHHLRYRKKDDTNVDLFKYIALDIIIIGIGFSIFSLPFSLNFKPLQIASSVGMVCPPNFLIKIGSIGRFVFEPDHCQRSPFWQLLILYGFFYFWVISFMVFFFIRQDKKNITVSPTDVFVFLLIVMGTLLIIIPEFVYLKDIYATYFRANTMFKLVYQSFLMLSIASGYSIIRLFSQTTLREKLFLLPYIILGSIFLTVVSIYPYFAVSSYYDSLRTYHGLNGITYLNTSYPTDAPAITWLNVHVSGQPVILEAQGDSYTDYARISANTGLPTVLGWPVHEWLWRGTYDVASPRIADIQTLYESTDISITENLLRKYRVSYVFLGELERKKYKLDETKWDSLGKVIYQNGTTKIYQLLAL